MLISLTKLSGKVLTRCSMLKSNEIANRTSILIDQLKKYHLQPDKKLGQHYLVDESVLGQIIDAASIKAGELVVEIGAGPGVLTRALTEAGAEVLAVEFDRDFCKLLQAEFHNWRNVHVLCDDALRLDFADLRQGERPYQKMVANIPYQITNPLIRKILGPESTIQTAVLLIQKEVAERLSAPPGSAERGTLTVLVEYYGGIEKILDVPATAFWPAPKVESSVVRLRRIEPKRQAGNDQAFFWFIRQAFSGKRKVLTNSMVGGLQLAKAAAAGMIEASGISPLARAEDLTLDQWLDLFENYQEGLTKDGK